MLQLAEIARGADTARLDLAPQCAGLLTQSLGLSAQYTDDHEMPGHGMTMYDAHYAWIRLTHDETHSWVPQTRPTKPPGVVD